MITWLAFLLGFWLAWGIMRVASETFSEIPTYLLIGAALMTLGTALGLTIVGLAVTL